MGPLVGPFIGGFITTSYLGWRWTAYIPAFMAFASCILALFFQKESYAPVILVSKASELRRLTKNWGIHAKQEEVEVDLVELVTKNVSRPLRILFTEPIVLLVSFYMAFLYGLLYLFLTAYALVFQEVHGFSPGVGGLPYFGFILGEILGFIAIVLVNPAYVRKLEANHNVPVPEWRLPVVMAGGISFTIGEFTKFGYKKRRKIDKARTVLVWLDWIHQKYSLDCSNFIWNLFWLWHFHSLPAIAQLHRRCLFDVRCLGTRRQHVSAKSVRSHFPPICYLYVRWNWYPVGHDTDWVRISSAGADALLLLFQRQDSSRQEQVCARTRYRNGDEER